MIDAGVNVFRVNFHADYADVKEKWKSLEILMMSMDILQQYLETYKDQNFVGVMNEGDSTWRWFNYVYNRRYSWLKKSVHEI
jgi:hypothetical protein